MEMKIRIEYKTTLEKEGFSNLSEFQEHCKKYPEYLLDTLNLVNDDQRAYYINDQKIFGGMK